MDKYEIQTIEVDIAEIPSIITSQFKEMSRLQEHVEIAIQKAGQAKEAANRAFEKSTGLGHKKEAIESLQSATVDLAEAQVSETEAQMVSFEYQKQLGKITQYLFALGVSNLAANRSVVRELELKLSGATKEELSDLARQELLNVVRQLKAQQDLMDKQNELSKKVKRHEETLIHHQAKSEVLAKQVQAQANKNAEQDRKLDASVRKDVWQDNKIAEQAQKDAEHDQLLTAGAARDVEHDKALAKQAEKDKQHDKLLQKLQQENAVLIKKIEENTKAIEELQNSKTDKRTTLISYAIAGVAFLVALIQFFL